MAELNGRRIAAVLTANAHMELRIDRLTKLDSHFHQLAYADLIELCKGIVLEDLCIIVCAQELTSVITGEAECHLGKVVGAEAEEVSCL